MMADSQAVKNTCNASVESKGFCFDKATNGIKRHRVVDTLGFPFITHGTAANLSDDAGLLEVLIQNMDYFRSKPVNLPKLTLLLDNGYHLQRLEKALTEVYPQIMQKIRFELSPKASKPRKPLRVRQALCP